jgi:hypothetical protein
MRGPMFRVVLAAAFVSTAVVAQAQQTSTSSETKKFQILAVDGNHLVVRLPEGTRELTVPDDFRFTVNDKQLSVHELKAGMSGTATVTTKTTVTPVSVTEVKNGTVYQRSGGSITVQTPEGFKMFTQGDIDKRGVKILRDGKPIELSELNRGDRLSATIVTSAPPRILTEKEVNATVPAASAAGAGAGAGAAPAAAAPSAAAKPTPSSTSTSGAGGAAAPARTLPKTASSWPLLALLSALSLAIGFGLTARRRFAS